MSKKKVLTGVERKASLLEAGAKLASKHGVKNVTRRMVAKAAGVSEALVSSYMGTTATAQRAYARKAKALKLPLPDKAKEAALGAKLRAHGPREKAAPRKRSIKEVKAIKNKTAVGVRKDTKPNAIKLAKRKVARSAIDGEFVTKAEAKANPKTTVTQTVKAGKAKKSAPRKAKAGSRARSAQPDSPKPAVTKLPMPAAIKPAKPAVQKQPQPVTTPTPTPTETKTAAREPKAPPANLVNLL